MLMTQDRRHAETARVISDLQADLIGALAEVERLKIEVERLTAALGRESWSEGELHG